MMESRLGQWDDGVLLRVSVLASAWFLIGLMASGDVSASPTRSYQTLSIPVSWEGCNELSDQRLSVESGPQALTVPGTHCL